MSDLVASLDNALAVDGEDVILRRVVGTGSAVANIDVKCRARCDAATTEQIAAGILATDFNVIISPTQINNAQWPGGTIPQLPPFDVDQSIPRAGVNDKILMRGLPPKAIAAADTKIIGGVVVRHNLRVTG